MNNFVFSGIHNLQKTGSAMGTICSPTCINIFMRKFEKTFVHTYTNFQTFTTDFSLIKSFFGKEP